MEVKAGYKHTEVGVLPADWEVDTLKNLILQSPDYGLNEAAIPFNSKHPTYLRITDITNDGKYTNKNKVSVAISNYDQYILADGDLVFARTGASVGRTYLYNLKDGILVFAGFLIRFRTNKDKLIPKFLFYFCQTKYYWNWVKENSMRSGQPGINSKEYSSINIPLPPTLAEQESIAEALSDTDALIEALEALIAKKRRIKEGVMQELLTGKRRLPGFSGEWEEKRIGELFNIYGGLSISREHLSNNGFCYLHYGDIHLSTKNSIDPKLESQNIPKLDISLSKIQNHSLLEDGDVVFVDASEDEEGSSKHIIIFNETNIPFISGLHTIIAKSKNNKLDKRYKQYCFKTKEVKKQFRFYAVGTKVLGVSKSNIVKISIKVPDIKEQQEIANVLDRIEFELIELEEKLSKTKKIKEGMMQELLTGRTRLI